MAEEKNKNQQIESSMEKARFVYLFGELTESKAEEVVKRITLLNHKSKKPIYLWINTAGGDLESGFGISDLISNIGSPVITIICGMACSAGSLISISGDLRLATKNSAWMTHPFTDYIHDYAPYIKDRVKTFKQIENMILNLYKRYTKLSKKDFKKLQNGELWVMGEDLLKKGIIDDFLSKDTLLNANIKQKTQTGK